MKSVEAHNNFFCCQILWKYQWEFKSTLYRTSIEIKTTVVKQKCLRSAKKKLYSLKLSEAKPHGSQTLCLNCMHITDIPILAAFNNNPLSRIWKMNFLYPFSPDTEIINCRGYEKIIPRLLGLFYFFCINNNHEFGSHLFFKKPFLRNNFLVKMILSKWTFGISGFEVDTSRVIIFSSDTCPENRKYFSVDPFPARLPPKLVP